MMGNPLTDESRDVVLKPNISGFCTRLRVPASLQYLFTAAKPEHVPLGDFILKSCLDAHLSSLIMGGRYREVQATLAALFGPAAYGPDPRATDVVGDYERSPAAPAANGNGRR
jgi:hypothetical protein